MLRKLFKQKRYLKNIYKSQKGITGLETAIILIAFVVVAAVFAYTVLSAGLFSTQKSQEAVYSGLERTQSTLELKSSVVATGEDVIGNRKVTHLTFTLAIVSGGNAMDFTAPSGQVNGIASGDNSITVSYIDKSQRIDNLYWTVSAVGQDNGNNLLESNEQFQIVVGNLVTALPNPIIANSTFTIEIKTARGAVLSFQRTMPGFVNLNNDLH